VGVALVEVNAIAVAAAFPGGTPVVAIAAVLLVGVEFFAFAVAVREIVLAPAFGAVALGVIAAILVLVAVLTDLFAGRQGDGRGLDHGWHDNARDQTGDEPAPGVTGGKCPG